MYRPYVEDTHAWFISKEQSREIQILNKQVKQVQFIIEDENEEKCLNFLEIEIKNNNGRYEFDAHRKPALMNAQIKQHFCIRSDKITSIFKLFLARPTKVCSKIYLRAGIEYLTDMFCENEYDQKTLQKIINNFEKKTRSLNNTNNKLTKSKQLSFLGYLGPKI